MSGAGQRSSVPELGREPALLAWIATRGREVARLVNVDDEPEAVAHLDGGAIALRSSYGVDAAVFAVVPGGVGPGPSAREAWASYVEALTGLPRSRFLADLEGDDASVERSAETVVLAALGRELPKSREDRVAMLVGQLRHRGFVGELFAHALPSAEFGQLVSRDLRTGARGARGQLASSPRALVESVATFRPSEELGPGAAALAPLLDELEVHTERPVRLAFLVGSEGPLVVGAAALARAGRASFALAVDLVGRGATTAARALPMIDVRDVPTALGAELVRAPGDELVRGVAAGVGVLSGHVVTTPDGARALSAAGVPSVLLLAGADEDDLDGVHAADAIVATSGGITGHFAVVARGLGKPCLAAGSALRVEGATVAVRGGAPLVVGSRVTVDGGAGVVVRGAATRIPAETTPEAATLLSWAEAPPVAALVAGSGDVTSARRFGCERVVVAGDSMALSAHAEEAPLEGALDELFASIAAEGYARASIALPRWSAAALLAAEPRLEAISADALAPFARAAERAASRHGVTVELAPPMLDAATLTDEQLAATSLAQATVLVTPARAAHLARAARTPPAALACLPEHARAVRLCHAASSAPASP